jgi:O-antigen ligase
MMTSARLLNFCCIILIVTSFSFVSEEARVSTEVTVTGAHIAGRIIPTFAVIVCCLIAIPKRQLMVFREMGRPPFVLWNWYALTATISGFASGLQPLWSAWKCFEVVVAMFWGASVAVEYRSMPDSKKLTEMFSVVYWLCLIFCVVSVVVAFNRGIGLYLSGQERFQLDWPLINPLTLSVMAAFALIGGLLSLRRISLIWRFAMSIPPLGALLLARSRTGLLALLFAAAYAIVCSRLEKSFRVFMFLLITAMLALMIASPDLRKQFRMSDISEISKGSGRIEDAQGRSAWGECLRLIKKSPLVGYGYINLPRFVYHYKFTVGDNGALQALVAGGIIGAVPAILYVLFLIWRWIYFASQVSVTPNLQERVLFGYGVGATCVAVTKSLTTNSLSVSDFAIVLFLLGVIACQTVGREMSAAKRAARQDAQDS